MANHQIKFHREMAVKVTILSIPVMVVAVLMSCIANFGALPGPGLGLGLENGPRLPARLAAETIPPPCMLGTICLVHPHVTIVDTVPHVRIGGQG